MTNTSGDNSLGTGVFYAEEDYLGIGKRLLILAIDFVVVVSILFFSSVLWFLLPINEAVIPTLEWGALVFCFLYLTIIKASKIRTLGYRLVGAKILTLKGEKPSIFRMAFRLLLWVLGPLNLIMDLIWIGIDPDRQSIRDRFVGTCVVRVNAIPIGEAPIHLAYYQAFFLSLMLPTVCRTRRA